MRLVQDGREEFLGSWQRPNTQRRYSWEVFAPGRINLIGEHTDYNGGKVMPFALDRGVTLRCLADSDGNDCPTNPTMTISSALSGDVFTTDWSTCLASPALGEALPTEIRRSWIRYVAGSCILLAHHAHSLGQTTPSLPVHRVMLAIDANLPRGAGLSSSAALCVGLLSALSLTLGIPLSADGAARLAMQVEHAFAGTKCGLMDQLAVVASRSGQFTSIDFAGFPSEGKYAISSIGAHEFFDDYVLVAFHTGVTHSLADSAYNERRASCEEALLLLNAHYGTHLSSLGAFADPTVFKRSFQAAPGELAQNQLIRYLNETAFARHSASMTLAKRAAHAILENHRVDAASLALVQGDATSLSQAMRASHASLRDDYEVSCEELDLACESCAAVATALANSLPLPGPALLGPRMTGGGFGGSTIQWIHRMVLPSFVKVFSSTDNPYTRATGKLPKLIVSRPENGLRIAIL